MEDWTARQDQTNAAVKTLAQLLGEYRRELIIAGFSPEDAFRLVEDYHAHVLEGALTDD